MCHGFVLWIDYVMDTENNTVLSTGPGWFSFEETVDETIPILLFLQRVLIIVKSRNHKFSLND